MFIDETVVEVKAGNGGNGCFAYDRAKYKPKGPPSGGSGGRGGHIFIEGSSQLHTLQDVAYHKTYRAERGTHGKGSNKHGRGGKDVVIPVPLGTLVYDEDSGELLFDCTGHEPKKIVVRGGRGGRGNAALVSRHDRNPRHAEEGKPGEQKRLRLVLKLLADIGLVGRPNAGKSTLLSRISKARPRIADYPFTTTSPNLGIVKSSGGFGSFVVADIPGLIEGSHTGKGLGTRFLRHIERTRILAILVESTSSDPVADAEVLVSELSSYNPLLARKPHCHVLTKSDLLGDGAKAPKGWVTLSAVTGEGLGETLREFESILSAEAQENREATANDEEDE